MKNLFFVLFFLSSLFCSAQKTEKLTVYFAFNKHDLDSVSKNKIDNALQNRTITEVHIDAHCDSIGSNDYNDVLSLKRAIEVKKYIISKKIDEALINVKASGKRIPLNKNETETARALNRRAEIVFVIKDKNAEPVVKQEIIYGGTGTVIRKDTTINPVHIPDARPIDIKDLNIDSVEVGSVFRLSNLNFVGGRHVLLHKSEPTLKLLLDIMKKNPTLKIEIDGYVCCTPDDRDGLDWGTGTYDLSVHRAKAIYEYLIENGIDRKRLYYVGYGGSHKLVVERTEEDMTTNRRVEIKILKK